MCYACEKRGSCEQPHLPPHPLRVSYFKPTGLLKGICRPSGRAKGALMGALSYLLQLVDIPSLAKMPALQSTMSGETSSSPLSGRLSPYYGSYEPDIKPGTILCVDEQRNIPAESVFYKDSRVSSTSLLGYPMLILSISTNDQGVQVASFLPLLDLSVNRTTKEALRESLPRLIWHQHILVDETWCADDIAELAHDPDYQAFPHVKLGSCSLRTNKKHYIFVDTPWQIEVQHLVSYPSRLSSRIEQPPKALPNPRVFIDDVGLKSIEALAKKYSSHPLSLPSPGRQSPSLLGYEPIQVNHIYTLPLTSVSPYLNQAQSFSYFERPLGKPFVVTGLGIDESGTPWVEGFILTHFHSQPITSYFSLQDEKTRWIRSQYLPVEGPLAVQHDEIPFLSLGKDSRRVGGEGLSLPGEPDKTGGCKERSYVHALKCYKLPAYELLGRGEAFLATESVEMAKSWQEHLKRVQLRKKMRMGGIHLRNQRRRGLAGIEVSGELQQAETSTGRFGQPIVQLDGAYEGGSAFGSTGL
ncbi:hypothetical protein M011DRAFT_298581 [Sporormia fimetaria CBS 119925]|uniref:Uncharacterized protein n=1 Tax=Sporormia fimetaria CBS 119925 TaxID=1340428 RepID=A0A6A6UYA9_9PLEO|nr:hypothetical protein M011DRAFT_298581 [Sporormia fimetaria CBS 119925]